MWKHKFYKNHSQSYTAQHNTTHIQVLQVTSFDFVNKPSSDLCLYQKPSSDNLFLHVGLKSHSFTIYVMKFNEIQIVGKMMEYRKL
jgi:hypothetical protein